MKLLLLIMAVVCNLNFFTPATTVTLATGPSNADGQVYVNAIDGDGNTIRYNIGSDFDYSTGGQLSGTFTGLVPGTYTVYARSGHFCLKTLDVVIGYAITYGPRYRLDFIDSAGSGLQMRFDLEERSYVGAVTEVKGNESPVVQAARLEEAQDPFTPIASTQLNVTFISETDGQFLDLYTGDERKFRGSLYRWDGDSYELVFRGYQIPMLYMEPYDQEENYPVSFVFTDGLADLAQYTFSDGSGNEPTTRISVFQGILFCLRKTEIDLNIWTSGNILNVGMSNDYALSYVYFDPNVFKDGDTMADCKFVLGKLLENFGCRIYQAEGRWNIDVIVLKAASQVFTDKRTFNGGTISSGSLEEPRIMLRRKTAPGNKVVYRDRSQVMNIVPQFGTIKFTFDLGIEEINNLLVSGEFEDEDIANGQMKGWQFETAAAPSEYDVAIEKDKSRPGFDLLKISWVTADLNFISERTGTVSSQPVNIKDPSVLFRMRLSFEVYTKPVLDSQYIYLDYSVQLAGQLNNLILSPAIIDNGYGDAQHFGIDSAVDELLVDGEWIRVYIDEHKVWKEITVDIEFDPVVNNPGELPGDLQVLFRISRNPLYDVDTLIDLRDVVTFTDYATLNHNNRRRVRDTVGTDIYIRSYVLEGDSSSADDNFNSIEPNDNVLVRWKLKNSILSPELAPQEQESWLSYIQMRNVRLEYFPNAEEPVETVTEEVVVNANIKPVLEKTFLLGDIVGTDIDQNYQYISKGGLTLSDGTPTDGNWFLFNNDSVPGSGVPLLQLLRQMYQGQISVERWRETGNMHCVNVVPTLAKTVYEVRTGRIYYPMAPVIDWRKGIVQQEMIEILKGEAVIDEGDAPDPDVEPPISTREHTNEFTDEFS